MYFVFLFCILFWRFDVAGVCINWRGSWMVGQADGSNEHSTSQQGIKERIGGV